MNCPNCNAPVCDTWTRCGVCRYWRLNSPYCSGSDLPPPQRAYNYLAYQMEVIAHRLDNGDTPTSVSQFALESRDYAATLIHPDNNLPVKNAQKTSQQKHTP